MKKIRLIAAEDDPDYRTLIAATLCKEADIEICALCQNGTAAFQAAIQQHPDIAIMDLNLDTTCIDGAEMSRAIRLKTDTKVIILTAFDSPDVVISACRQAFASSYVLKSQSSLLLPTIRATAAGTTPQSMLICASLLEMLTPAEKTIFERMMGRDIILRSKEKTIANQQASILRKFGLHSTEELNHIFRAYYSAQC